MAVLMLFAHEVKDYDAWKARYDANRRLRDDARLVEQFVGPDATKANIVHVGLMAPSLEAAREFVSRPELRDAMASAGVANAPEIRFVLVG
jgi:hypothetical protein